MDTQPFIQALSEARRELATTELRLQELAKLQEKYRSLEQFIARCEDIIRYEVPELAVTRDGLHRPTIGDMVVRDDLLWEVIVLVLDKRQRPMTPGEMLVALNQEGFAVRGEHKRENIRSILARKDDLFEKVGRGLFALKKWPDSVKASRQQDALLPDLVNYENAEIVAE